MQRERIQMGVVGKPHGVRGLLRVHSFAADPFSLAEYSPLLDDRGRAWTLEWRGEGVAQLTDATGKPVNDRNAAEKLTNLKLFVPRERLAEPDPEEFYLADLIGLQALNANGEPMGQVIAVHDYGAGTSLEIARPEATPLVVPFTRGAVPDINLATRTLTVQPPAEIEAREAAA